MGLPAFYSTLGKSTKKKCLLWLLPLLVLFCYCGYKLLSFINKEFMVAEELPYYDVGIRPDDDTLRVAIIGDSWAQWHATYNCDTLFERYWDKLTSKPIKCHSRGRGGAKTKEVYHYLFRSQTYEYSQEFPICTQPLIEEHPDYCVIMAGINDAWMKRSVSYYTGNYQLILRLLLANRIRPVVMEIPDFDLTSFLERHKSVRTSFRIYSYFNGVVEDDVTPYRVGLIKMLKDNGFEDDVLFIPANHWLPNNHQFTEEIYQLDHTHLNDQGYHLLDSCMVSDIYCDYNLRAKK